MADALLAYIVHVHDKVSVEISASILFSDEPYDGIHISFL